MGLTPSAAAWRLGCSLVLGGGLGLFYGFLHPPGKRHRLPADLVFSLALIWAWLYHSFAICQGDIRAVYLLGMSAGILLWECSFGQWLQPVFSGFWRSFSAISRLALFPWKKILGFVKILFASAEKWVTIKCTKIFESSKMRRKESHGRKKHPAENRKSGSSSHIQYP